MKGKILYEFSGEIWKHPSPAGWHFISLPEHLSKEIRENSRWQEEGWGRMKAEVEIGEVLWETAIWFDSKLGTYLLPIKAKVREKAKIQKGDRALVKLWI